MYGRTESYCSIVELLHARSCNTGGACGCQSITLLGLCVNVDGIEEFRYCPVRRRHYRYSQGKKTSAIPVPSKARFKSPGGFSEGVWSGSSAAVRAAALFCAYLLSKYRPSLCTAVSRPSGRGGAVVPHILSFSLIRRPCWYLVHSALLVLHSF